MFRNPGREERCVAWRAEQVPSALCLDATPERDTRCTDYTRFVRTSTVASPQAGPLRHATVRLLRRVKNIAVVGLSPNPARPSHEVAAAMQKFGYYIIPVRPAVKAVLGESAFARLSDVNMPIDLVNVFRAAEFIDGVVDECIALRMKALWMQDGIVNQPAAERAVAAGITVVMDRCIYREYRNECS